jgi:hypothetical protein
LDKHKAIVPVGMAFVHVALKLTLPSEWQSEGYSGLSFPILAADRLYPLKDNTELFSGPADHIQVHGDPEFAFEVAFGEGQIVDGEPVLPTLHQLVEFVERVIGIAERCVLSQHGGRP